MCVVAAIAGGAVVSSAVSSRGAKKAASAQEKATEAATAQAEKANDVQWRMYEQNREDQQPYRDIGTQNLGTLNSLMNSGELSRGFAMSDLMNDPIYQERLRVGIPEGMTAVERAASAGGGLQSGATLKALARFRQDFASNEGGNAFNRFKSNQGDKFNRYAALAGVGQAAANQTGVFGQNTANAMGQNYGQIGNNLMQGGNARASGYIGSANAINNGIGQIGNAYQQSSMFNRLMG